MQSLCNRVTEELRAPPVLQLLLDGGTALTRQLIEDKRAALISFTGSTTIGREVARAVASRLGRALLELGGNGAIIVDESADLALATRAIVFGALATAGQRCTTTRRVLVVRARLPELQRRLVAAYRQVRIGDPRDPATLMGPLIDRNAVHNYERALAAALAVGGELLAGGAVLDRPGNYVEPAIVLASNDWEIVQRETFAPILYLIPLRFARTGHRTAEPQRLRIVLGAVHPAAGRRRAVLEPSRQRLRHRQYQPRHLRG